MLEQINIYGQSKLEVTLERFRAFEPKEGYFLAFSGGKDSCVIKALADMAEVKYDAHYTVTSVDPPELVQFIKKYHPDVSMDIPRYQDDYKNPKLRGKQITMWNLIPEKKMPPTRIVRYCCAELKEPHGEGRFVVTGVRHSESVKRSHRGGLELAKRKSHRMTNYDPDEPTDEMMYHCQIWARKMLNPIIDWTEDEVWEFIHKHNIPYCELYDQGWTRLGCIGCPMGSVKQRRKEFERWPKYKRMYIKAFDRMIKQRNDEGFENPITNPEKLAEEWENGTLGKSNYKKKSGGGTKESTTPSRIEITDKKIVGLPKWNNDSTGEEVLKWWIR